jgi:hypothetical protein
MRWHDNLDSDDLFALVIMVWFLLVPGPYLLWLLLWGP